MRNLAGDEALKVSRGQFVKGLTCHTREATLNFVVRNETLTFSKLSLLII